MIPQGSILPDLEEAREETSHTYKLRLNDGRIGGFTDGVDAVKQAVFKILSTNRFDKGIYSTDYGFEKLLGVNFNLIEAELPSLITEALLQDERITAVENVSFVGKGDQMQVYFTVVSAFGDFRVDQEVSRLVRKSDI